jgi:hypothetical protein
MHMASTRRNGGTGRKNGKARLAATSRQTLPAETGNRGNRTTSMEAKPTRTEITRQAVAEAAYYLWLRQGGDDVSNWLEAERQLSARTPAAGGAR